MNRIKPSIQVVIAACWLTCVPKLEASENYSSADYDKYNYVHWFERGSLEIISPKGDVIDGWIVTAGHSFEKATFCAASSGFHCFFSRSFAFVVPKSGLTEKKWQYDEWEFRVVHEGLSICILGKCVEELFIIEAPMESSWLGRTREKSTYWLYSESMGIVGFGLNPMPDGTTHTYWLAGLIGFGKIEP